MKKKSRKIKKVNFMKSNREIQSFLEERLENQVRDKYVDELRQAANLTKLALEMLEKRIHEVVNLGPR